MTEQQDKAPMVDRERLAKSLLAVVRTSGFSYNLEDAFKDADHLLASDLFTEAQPCEKVTHFRTLLTDRRTGITQPRCGCGGPWPCPDLESYDEMRGRAEKAEAKCAEWKAYSEKWVNTWRKRAKIAEAALTRLRKAAPVEVTGEMVRHAYSVTYPKGFASEPKLNAEGTASSLNALLRAERENRFSGVAPLTDDEGAIVENGQGNSQESRPDPKEVCASANPPGPTPSEDTPDEERVREIERDLAWKNRERDRLPVAARRIATQEKEIERLKADIQEGVQFAARLEREREQCKKLEASKEISIKNNRTLSTKCLQRKARSKKMKRELKRAQRECDKWYRNWKDALRTIEELAEAETKAEVELARLREAAAVEVTGDALRERFEYGKAGSGLVRKASGRYANAELEKRWETYQAGANAYALLLAEHEKRFGAGRKSGDVGDDGSTDACNTAGPLTGEATPSGLSYYVGVESGHDARTFGDHYAGPIKVHVNDECVYDSEIEKEINKPIEEVRADLAAEGIDTTELKQKVTDAVAVLRGDKIAVSGPTPPEDTPDEERVRWREAMKDHPIKSCGRLDGATFLPENQTVGRVTSDRVRYIYFEEGQECVVLGDLCDFVAFRSEEHDNRLAAQEKEIERLTRERDDVLDQLNDRNYPCAEALEFIWTALGFDYSWEYPAEAAREIKARFEVTDQQARRANALTTYAEALADELRTITTTVATARLAEDSPEMVSALAALAAYEDFKKNALASRITGPMVLAAIFPNQSWDSLSGDAPIRYDRAAQRLNAMVFSGVGPGMEMNEPDYDAVVAMLSKECHCCLTCSDVPCEGVLAGGLCDERCTCDYSYEDDLDRG